MTFAVTAVLLIFNRHLSTCFYISLICCFLLKTSYVVSEVGDQNTPSIQQTGEFPKGQWQQATTRGNRVYQRGVQFMPLTV